LSSAPAAPVVRVSARTGLGLKELWEVIAGLPLRRQNPTPSDDLLRLAQEALAARFLAAESAGEPAVAQLLNRWQRGEMDARRAGEELLRLLAGR
jgi:hypothetical protein